MSERDARTAKRPIAAERCPVCGGFRALRAFAGYDKAICRGTSGCMAQLLEEVKSASDAPKGASS